MERVLVSESAISDQLIDTQSRGRERVGGGRRAVGDKGLEDRFYQGLMCLYVYQLFIIAYCVFCCTYCSGHYQILLVLEEN